MTESQSQKTAKDSIAIQSARDTHITSGITEETVRAIIETVADQIPKYAAIAGTLVDQRLKEFEEKIVDRFENDGRSDASSFQDPDFLSSVYSAQQSYAKSGDEELGNTLADLIVERSQAEKRTRTSLVLNKAIDTVPYLTKAEFCVLAIGFLVRMVSVTSDDQRAIAKRWAGIVQPHLDGLPDQETSYLYLESLGCGKISLTSHTALDAFNNPARGLQKFPTVGAVKSQISENFFNRLSDAGFLKVVNGEVVRLHDSLETLNRALSDAGMEDPESEIAFSAMQPQDRTADEMEELLNDGGDWYSVLVEKWDQTPLKSFQLSAVGIAIAHSYLSQDKTFDAPITIWLK